MRVYKEVYNKRNSQNKQNKWLKFFSQATKHADFHNQKSRDVFKFEAYYKLYSLFCLFCDLDCPVFWNTWVNSPTKVANQVWKIQFSSFNITLSTQKLQNTLYISFEHVCMTFKHHTLKNKQVDENWIEIDQSMYHRNCFWDTLEKEVVSCKVRVLTSSIQKSRGLKSVKK